MFLVDTNVWLERLLDQQRSEGVRRFLEETPADALRVTAFSFHSVGIILSRFGRGELLSRFVHDVFLDTGVEVVALEPRDIDRLLEVIAEFRFDFDDAYQYVAAEKFKLQIVSFDADFDRTPQQRLLPVDAAGRS
jgi:predicted nucleic acid-binding protein